LSSFAAMATPGMSSKSKELFLGSNHAEFAVLRTVREVRGSYFVSYYKKYLDVYVKEDETKEGIGEIKLKKSTLMLDFVEDRVDGSKLDVTVKGAEITSLIKQRLGYGPYIKEEHWEIVEVMRDSNSIYLKVKVGGNHKYVCVLPAEVKHLESQVK